MQQDKKRRDANLFVNCRLVDRSTNCSTNFNDCYATCIVVNCLPRTSNVSCELFTSAMSHGIDIHRSSKYICCEEHR